MVDEVSEIMCSQIITPKLIEHISKITRNMAHPVENTASLPQKAIHDALDRIKNAGG